MINNGVQRLGVMLRGGKKGNGSGWAMLIQRSKCVFFDIKQVFLCHIMAVWLGTVCLSMPVIASAIPLFNSGAFHHPYISLGTGWVGHGYLDQEIQVNSASPIFDHLLSHIVEGLDKAVAYYVGTSLPIAPSFRVGLPFGEHSLVELGFGYSHAINLYDVLLQWRSLAFSEEHARFSVGLGVVYMQWGSVFKQTDDEVHRFYIAEYDGVVMPEFGMSLMTTWGRHFMFSISFRLANNLHGVWYGYLPVNVGWRF